MLAEYQGRLRPAIAAHAGHDRVHLLDLTAALPDEVILDLGRAKADRVDIWVDLLVDRLLPLPRSAGRSP
jgi:hypothetical protein